MAVILHNRHYLKENPISLRIWKIGHIVLFVLISIFGIANYCFLMSTEELVEGRCVLFPETLRFTTVEVLADYNNDTFVPPHNFTEAVLTNETDYNPEEYEVKLAVKNVTVAIGKKRERLVLDLKLTSFGRYKHCQFAEYIPLLSSIFATIWIFFFIMCPSGVNRKNPFISLSQPWRIVPFSLMFTIFMIGPTVYSFILTERGLTKFCSDFYDYTNTTTCSSVDAYLERSWHSPWSWGGRVAATRAASAAVWAGWLCAAALLLARCITAPDFHLQRTAAVLLVYPDEKTIPDKNSKGTLPQEDSPTKSQDTASTQLVSASLEPNPEPISAINSPAHDQYDLEMGYLNSNENESKV